jgi:flavin reductase (DIM6/NTAB) family NADH-FMN oxidoreductase RutF
MTCYLASELEEASCYRLLTGLVLPRPIALVSSRSAVGTPNLAPFSFFTVASTAPPVLSISVSKRFGQEPKDTAVNIIETGEFVINVVSEPILAAMNIASFYWPSAVDEFEKAGLTAVYDGRRVSAPRVREALASFECRHVQSVTFGHWMVLFGEVLAIRCEPDIVDRELRIDLGGLQPVGRLSGDQYCHVQDRFSLARSGDTPDRGTRHKRRDRRVNRRGGFEKVRP